MYKVQYYKDAWASNSLISLARYTPWHHDKFFMDCYFLIKHYTMMPITSLWNVWCLVGQASKVKEGALLDVGTWRGGCGSLIMLSAALHGVTNHIYLCDTFCGITKSNSDVDVCFDGEYSVSDSREATVSHVNEILETIRNKWFLSYGPVYTLSGIFPDETGKLIEDSKIRFCLSSVGTYQCTFDVINFAKERLVLGGIIFVECYGYSGSRGAISAVESFRQDKDFVLITLPSAGAALIKVG